MESVVLQGPCESVLQKPVTDQKWAWFAGRCDSESGSANLQYNIRGSDWSVSGSFDISQAGSLRACGDYRFRVYLRNQ